MTSVAVVAHRGKSLGGGLDELRSELAHAGVEGLLWFEVPKSRKAPKQVAKAVAAGADLVFVWGGDGMVQRCASMPWPASRSRSPSCPPAPPTSSRRTSASRRTSLAPSASGCTVTAGSSTSG